MYWERRGECRSATLTGNLVSHEWHVWTDGAFCDSGGRNDGYSGYGQFNDHECNGSEDLYGRGDGKRDMEQQRECGGSDGEQLNGEHGCNVHSGDGRIHLERNGADHRQAR